MIATVYIALPLVLAVLVALFAMLGSFALFVAVTAFIRGSSWLWAQVRQGWRRMTGRRSLRVSSRACVRSNPR